MIKQLLFLFRPSYIRVLAYMLQNSEYDVPTYIRWFWRTSDYSRVMYRRELDVTRIARAVLLLARSLVVAEIAIGLLLVYLGFVNISTTLVVIGITVIVLYPFIVAHILILPVIIAGKMIIEPRRRQTIAAAKKIFEEHKATKIAVIGSYGKTSMKELLATVLGGGFKIAATPGNKNVAISHAKFAQKLDGSEEFLIIEYGEGAPGDIACLAKLSNPTHAIITGLAPAHLDRYLTLEAAAKDIFSITDFVLHDNVYVNDDSDLIKPFIGEGANIFNDNGALGWKVINTHVDLDGTSFDLVRGDIKMKIKSGLIGIHHIGPISLVATLAYEYGMTVDSIETAIAKTKPHEHRMSTYQLAGATVIDDTYNGNIEGIRAGLRLLGTIKSAGRKIYVTPGLVDQGDKTHDVHSEMGRLIAGSNPELVVLMKNSATQDIQTGLSDGGFAGEILIEDDPLRFYTHLDQYVAAGDVVLMQNDWTDNYA